MDPSASGLPSRPGLPVRPGIHWPSALQLALSLLAAFLSFSSAIGLVGLGFSQIISSAGALEQNLTVFIAAASAVLTGVLVLPSAWYSLLRLLGRPVAGPTWLAHLSNHPIPLVLALILLALTLLLGSFVSNSPALSLLLLPPLQLLAVGLPVYVFSSIGRWKISAGPPQRSWGIFAAGLVLGPACILILELLAGAAFALLAYIYVSLRPDLTQELTLLVERIRAAGNAPDAILRLVAPFLLNPAVVLVLFLFVSGIVPLIEEAFKPIGAWFVAGSHLTAAQGLAAGLISGTGYALFENLALSNTGSAWAATAIGRIGTGLLHITTAGLTGWALITAIKERRYLRLLAVYLLAVLIHGTWNALALLSAVSELGLSGSDGRYRYLDQISQGATVGLVVIIVIVFLILLRMNRVVRRSSPRSTVLSVANPNEPI